jgi:hypothetical protein
MFYQLIHYSTIVLCSLWISTTPTSAMWQQSCPAVNWQWSSVPAISGMAPVDTWLQIQAVNIASGEVLCSVPAFPNLHKVPCPEITRLDEYRLDLVFLDAPHLVCTASSPDPNQCTDIPDGRLEWRGPYQVDLPDPVIPCTLPPVNNGGDLTTYTNYDFLAGRLSWWGVNIDPFDWQNRFDEQIRGAADAAGVPARLLKMMIAAESQYWPLWTGDAGEVGWLQVTWSGADTALRHSEQLFERYCPRAIFAPRCYYGYDLLSSGEKSDVQAVLLADLRVEGVPTDAADMAASDLWISAQVLRGFACYGRELAPGRDAWETAAVLYNAGPACLLPDGFCPKGQEYLGKVMK